MAVQNTYLPTDGDLNQAKRKRAGEVMAIDAVPKQTSFDATNTPAARVQAGYSANPMIRQFQASNDRGAQNRATGQAMLSDNAQQTIARAAGGSTDAAMQAGAVRNAQAATGTVDRSNPAQEPYPGAAALQNRSASLGEAVVTNAGRDAINSALTAQPRPVPGNPARAAQMQAQFDQPVTAGGSPLIAGQPNQAQQSPGGSGGDGTIGGLLGRVGDYAQGVGNLGLGVVSSPATFAIDSVRQGLAAVTSSRLENPYAARDVSGRLMSDGVSNIENAFDGTKTLVQNAIGATPAVASQLPQPAIKQPTAAADVPGKPAAITPSPSLAQAADPNAYQPTGIGDGANAIVARMSNGVPEFTNDPTAQAGSEARDLFTGGNMQNQPPSGQMVAPNGSRVLASGTNATTEAQQFAQLGSARNLNNGIGTFSQAESGDAQLAYDRNERAIAERYKMNDISRRGEIGEGGGRVTVVRDSSRVPSRDDRLRARNDEQIARTEGLRTDAQLGLKRDARESADSQLNRGVQQQQLQVGNLDMADRQRIQSLYAQYESAAPGDRAALAEQIRVLTGKDQAQRFTVVPGGQEVDPVTQQLVTRPALVINNQTGSFVDQRGGGQPSDISTDAKALAIRDNSKLSREEKAAQLKALGYN